MVCAVSMSRRRELRLREGQRVTPSLRTVGFRTATLMCSFRAASCARINDDMSPCYCASCDCPALCQEHQFCVMLKGHVAIWKTALLQAVKRPPNAAGWVGNQDTHRQGHVKEAAGLKELHGHPLPCGVGLARALLACPALCGLFAKANAVTPK